MTYNPTPDAEAITPTHAPAGSTSGSVPTLMDCAHARRPLPSWSAEGRLRTLLGRPALAKRVADTLPNATVIELCDVLEASVKAYTDKLHRDLDRVVTETLQRLADQADQYRAEIRTASIDRERVAALTAERFGPRP